MLNQRIISRTTFHLTHLTAQYSVGSLGITAKLNAAYIGTHTRRDHKGNLGSLLFFINLGKALYLSKGIAFVAEPTSNILTGRGH